MKKKSVIVGNDEVDLEIIRSSRRTMALYVRPGGALLIRAPWYVPVHVILHFVRGKTIWIMRQREQMKDIKIVGEPVLMNYGSVTPFLGNDLTIKPSGHTGNNAWLNGTQLLISVTGEPSPEKITTMVDGWYLIEARKYLIKRTAELAEKHSAVIPAPGSVNTRKMRRRWGTCHTNGALWFNRELIKKDPVLIDYVIIHELCHLVHHNHSKEYYTLLGSLLPDYRQLKKRLQQT
jgi:predicted metal-dependent hydrolase